jgi:hypothetical protein
MLQLSLTSKRSYFPASVDGCPRPLFSWLVRCITVSVIRPDDAEALCIASIKAA